MKPQSKDLLNNLMNLKMMDSFKSLPNKKLQDKLWAITKWIMNLLVKDLHKLKFQDNWQARTKVTESPLAKKLLIQKWNLSFNNKPTLMKTKNTNSLMKIPKKQQNL